MRASRVLAHAVAGALVLAVGGVVRAAEGEVCAPWPGEISPLPSVEDRDPFAARWAQLRFAELSAVAESIASMDPSAAYRLLQHARCLSPRDASVEQRVSALVPGKEVVRAPVIARPRAGPARPKTDLPTQLADADALITSAASALAQARFREVLESSGRARTLLERLETSGEVRARQARLEVMAGTAELALDLEEAAALSLGRALRADPKLTLDDSTPPKVRRLFVAVRESLDKAQP